MTYMKIELKVEDVFEYSIKYPTVDYRFFRELMIFKNDHDICLILNNILLELDCTQMFDDKQVLSTGTLVYDTLSSKYYYYMLHFDNQYKYNSYLDRYINNHFKNVCFENHLATIVKAKASLNTPKTPKPKRTVKNNKYVKQTTTDLFTGKETYIYSKVVNGITETIQSDDPNLLDSLNAKPIKPKKEKARKGGAVPFSAMTFNFTKK